MSKKFNHELVYIYTELNKLCPLKHPIILIGGKVLEFYSIRKSEDFDFIIHKDDASSLYKLIEKNFLPYEGKNIDDPKIWNSLQKISDNNYPKVYPPDDLGKFWIDFRGDIGGIDIFVSIKFIDYDFLNKSAKSYNKKIKIASLNDLILLKSFVLTDSKGSQGKKAEKDIKKIINYLSN